MFSSNLSNIAESVNQAFVIILSVIFFFLFGLTAVMIYFIFKYRESKNKIASQIHGNNTLEVIWTVIPLLIVIAMFYYGWTGYKVMESDPPKSAIHINVTARMWKWTFNYMNGKRTDTLIVPQGKPVALELKALDVIHSFYIPAFRLKKDVIPGRERKAWFIANSPGNYDIFCSQYCGLNHSAMITMVKVLTPEEYNKWYADTSSVEKVAAITAKPGSIGKQIIQQTGCFACHSVDGTKIVGPSWQGIFGHEVIVVTNGKERTIKVDEEYIKRSILDPNTDVVKGFNKGLMLSYKDQLTDKDISHVIEYIKTLQ
jgi:cytochrome c oxidase subunit II